MKDKVFAKRVVEAFENKGGPKLTLKEAMSMQPIPTDCYEIYAIQKGDVTFLAWNCKDGIVVHVQAW